jgi:hypothetical protein
MAISPFTTTLIRVGVRLQLDVQEGASVGERGGGRAERARAQLVARVQQTVEADAGPI